MSQPKSSTLGDIDPVTRDRVIASADGKCWLCGLYGKHVTRVIAGPDLVLYHDLQQRGLIYMPDLNAFENLLYLCPGCHCNFDDQSPVWAFLPTNLDVFIDHEESFQARRQTLAAAGKPLPRVPRPKGASAVSYMGYQIRSGYLFPGIFTGILAKPWPGSPLAAIVRTARIGTGNESVSVENGGLPMDVALKLQRLLLLYGIEEPPIVLQVDRGLKRPVDNYQDLPENLRPDCPDLSGVRLVDSGPDRVKCPMSNRPDLPAKPVGKGLDLSLIGQAFNSVIEYVTDRANHRDLEPVAQAWLTTAVLRIMSQLKEELRSLHAHVDNPVLLPEFALNPEEELMLNSGDFPYVLIPYRAQFEEYLVQLLRSCGLTARPQIYAFGGNCILLSITFPPGAIYSESQTVGNRVFDPEVEKEFVRGVQSVKFEKR